MELWGYVAATRWLTLATCMRANVDQKGRVPTSVEHRTSSIASNRHRARQRGACCRGSIACAAAVP